MQSIRLALFLSALVCAGAFYPHHNYNYFILLKWVVFATSIWAAVDESEKKRMFVVAVFAVVALIHNPFFRFHFSRDTWLVIDGITGVWFIYVAITTRKGELV